MSSCEGISSSAWGRAHGRRGCRSWCKTTSAARRSLSLRCGRSPRMRCAVRSCRRRCPYRDAGDGRRRWRTLDLGMVQAYLEADAPRVSCPEHGVIVAAVPWARAKARHTHAFEDTCAWLTAHSAMTVVSAMMRVTWRTVAAIVTRVVDDLAGSSDRLDGLTQDRHRRDRAPQRTPLLDRRSSTTTTGRLVWAAPGREHRATLLQLLRRPRPERSTKLTHVSANGAEWIHNAVKATRSAGADLSRRLPRSGVGDQGAGRGAPRPCGTSCAGRASTRRPRA